MQCTEVANRPPTSRSRVTNDPLRRADGRTAAGRRVRDLYRAYMTNAANPEGDAFRAAALAAAELTVAAENARAKLLAGEGNLDQVVRIENLASRALRKLEIKAPAASSPRAPTLDEIAAEIMAEKQATSTL